MSKEAIEKGTASSPCNRVIVSPSETGREANDVLRKALETRTRRREFMGGCIAGAAGVAVTVLEFGGVVGGITAYTNTLLKRRELTGNDLSDLTPHPLSTELSKASYLGWKVSHPAIEADFTYRGTDTVYRADDGSDIVLPLNPQELAKDTGISIDTKAPGKVWLHIKGESGKTTPIQNLTLGDEGDEPMWKNILQFTREQPNKQVQTFYIEPLPVNPNIREFAYRFVDKIPA